MADIVLDHVTKRYPDGALAVDDINLDIADGEFVILVGPSGCGKSTTLQHDRRARGHLRGRPAHRRQGREQQGAQGPRHRHGVPELRALPAHDRAREHGLRRSSWPRPRRPTIDQKVDGGGPDPRPHRSTSTASRPTSRAASASAWRWAAPSCATRRRSSWTSRCRTSTPSCGCRCAPRSSRLQKRLGHDHGVRHPRPDRGHDARRPGGGHARAAPSSRSAARRSSTTTRSTSSWPASSARPAMNFMPATLEEGSAAHASWATSR